MGSGANSVSTSQRRLASVLAADVVGYTRLMELDEQGTHARLMRLRETVVLPEIARHHGRLVKNTGDGFLAMFDSARSATECGIAIQRGTLAQEMGIVPDRRIIFRMGVNVSEVIVEDHDIYGDGVNIAARLHAYAEPAGIAISGAVAELAGEFEGVIVTDLGQQQMRNLQHPVRVLTLRLNEAPLAVAGEALPGEETRPSIAVLPFRPGSSNLESYFTDGIVDNIIHALAALKELFVISRGSTLGFRGPSPDLRAIGKELGVRYILHGSVQRAGDRLRISTELTDTEAGEVVRTDRHDGKAEDIFDLQDQIAIDVVKSIAPHVRERELRRALKKRPQDLTAYDLVLQALDPLYRLEYTSFSRARGLLQRAMSIDPSYSLAFAYTAYWHVTRIGQGWSPDPTADTDAASRAAQLAITLDGRDALALAIFGHLRSYLLKDYRGALELFERALDSGPNCAMAWTLSSVTHGFLGDGPAALRCAERGLLLSPLGPDLSWHHHILSQAYYVNKDFDRAVHWARKAAATNSRQTSNFRTLAASLIALDEFEEAQKVAIEHMRVDPFFSLAKFLSRTPLIGELRDEFVQRLRGAGFPE